MAVGISVSVRRFGRHSMLEITVRPFKNDDQTYFNCEVLGRHCLAEKYGVNVKTWPARDSMTACVRAIEPVATFEESCTLKALIDTYPGWRLRYAEQLDSGEFTGPLWGDIPIVADRSCMDLTAEQFAALAATALRRPPPAPPPPVVPGNALFESVFGSVNDPVFDQLFFTPDVKDEDIPSMQAERLCVQRHDTVMIHGDLLEIYRDGQLIGSQPAWPTSIPVPVTVALKEKWSSKIET